MPKCRVMTVSNARNSESYTPPTKHAHTATATFASCCSKIRKIKV